MGKLLMEAGGERDLRPSIPSPIPLTPPPPLPSRPTRLLSDGKRKRATAPSGQQGAVAATAAEKEADTAEEEAMAEDEATEEKEPEEAQMEKRPSRRAASKPAAAAKPTTRAKGSKSATAAKVTTTSFTAADLGW